MHVKCLLEISPFEEIYEWCLIHKSTAFVLQILLGSHNKE